jgi:hypothetical protein
MLLKKEIPVNIPYRGDYSNLRRTTLSIFSQRLAIIVMGIVMIALIVLVMRALNQPRIVTIIDSKTGQTFAAYGNPPEFNTTITEQQVIYETTQFMKNYLSMNFQTVKTDREAARRYVAPQLITPDWLNRDSIDAMNAIAAQYTSRIEWLIRPSIQESNHPYYTSYAFVENIITLPTKTIKDRSAYILKWGSLNSFNPFERPHGLIMISLEKIAPGTERFNAIMSTNK